MKTTHVYGSISFAETEEAEDGEKHPYQTHLEIFITDFLPNANAEGVPESEKENIIRTARNTPLKINFDGADYYGHIGAYPIGTITSVEDKGEYITGVAVIWDDLYGDVSEYLKTKRANKETIGTSWEIGYTDEYKENGTTWLQGTVFLGTAIVDSPAYEDRAQILAIAEKIKDKHNKRLEKRLQSERLETMPNDEVYSASYTIAEDNSVTFTGVTLPASASIVYVADSTFVPYTLSEAEKDTIRVAAAEGMIELIASTFTEKGYIEQRVYSGHEDVVSALSEFIQSTLNEKSEKETAASTMQTELEAVKVELEALKEKEAERERLEAEAELFASRAEKLEGLVDIEARKDFILALSEADFEVYVEDMTALAEQITVTGAEKKEKFRVANKQPEKEEKKLSEALKESFRK
jgi:hypothetical protein